MIDRALHIRPLAAMIEVVRQQIALDGTRERVLVRVAVVQYDEGEPLDMRECRSLMPCALSDLTAEERAEALNGLRRDLRSRRERDPRYITRRVPEAA